MAAAGNSSLLLLYLEFKHFLPTDAKHILQHHENAQRFFAPAEGMLPFCFQNIAASMPRCSNALRVAFATSFFGNPSAAGGETSKRHQRRCRFATELFAAALRAAQRFVALAAPLKRLL